MGFWELLVLAVGLSMDAFAVAVCKGLSLRSLRPRHMAVVGAWFGAFQALMPAAGWLLGAAFAHRIAAIDHWIAFLLLGYIGGKMLGVVEKHGFHIDIRLQGIVKIRERQYFKGVMLNHGCTS